MKINLTFFIIPLCLAGCAGHQQAVHKKDSDTVINPVAVKQPSHEKNSEVNPMDTVAVRQLADGFSVHISKAGKAEIFRFDQRLYSDTALEYILESKRYPIFKKIDTNSYQLLLETQELPSRDLTVVFNIKDGQVKKEKHKLPLLDDKPEIIAGEAIYSGFWDYGEDWDVKNSKRYTTYNPMMYYKFTPAGITLDSALTISRIKKIYGRFRGFDYDSRIGYPVDSKGNIKDTTDKNVLRVKD